MDGDHTSAPRLYQEKVKPKKSEPRRRRRMKIERDTKTFNYRFFSKEKKVWKTQKGDIKGS